MKSLRIKDTLINLGTITRVSYDQNDADIVADNQCAIFFSGDGNDAFVVRGELAKPVFEKLSEMMNCEVLSDSAPEA